MLFTAPPANAADIRAFCAQFPEGIRVEYKGTFDENVRRNLPKVLSSFANSLGGVLIIGVETDNGVPRNPIQGFNIPQEEVTLTIENICFAGIYPPVISRIHSIRSDVDGRMFAVIEVDESWEAPHAIENSKKVYVRTGNAANPYDLADVDLIIELIRRRAEPQAKRQHLMETARQRAGSIIHADSLHAEISISPAYPRHALCTRSACWDFIANNRYRGAHYFPFNTLRRVEDGVASYDRTREYAQLSIDGFVLLRKILELTQGDENNRVILLRELLHPTIRLLHCAATYYHQVRYQGSLELKVSMNNVRQQRMLFLAGIRLGFDNLNDYMCFENAVRVQEIIQSEHLITNFQEIVQLVIREICWSFWQSLDQFPEDALNNTVAQILRDMGLARG